MFRFKFGPTLILLLLSFCVQLISLCSGQGQYNRQDNVLTDDDAAASYDSPYVQPEVTGYNYQPDYARHNPQPHYNPQDQNPYTSQYDSDPNKAQEHSLYDAQSETSRNNPQYSGRYDSQLGTSRYNSQDAGDYNPNRYDPQPDASRYDSRQDSARYNPQRVSTHYNPQEQDQSNLQPDSARYDPQPDTSRYDTRQDSSRYNPQPDQHDSSRYIPQQDPARYNSQPDSSRYNPIPVYRPVPQNPPPPSKDPNVIVVPGLGNVRGKIGYKVIRNRAVNGFLGLQYGTVTPGIGRFQKAVVPEFYSNDVIDATTEPKACPQYPNLKEIKEDEARGIEFPNCLYVNVHAPNTTGLLPVMVYVHGEMLFDGSAEEGQPDYLLEHDVVLVSVSYRLAPFGFLSSLTDDMPGNIALADLHMALEWVKRYIRPFGGNPEQVTLFGQAGGATLVHALSLGGKANGLFHKIILQSGTALNPSFIDEEPQNTGNRFDHQSGCPPGAKGLQGLVDCFSQKKTSEILETLKRLYKIYAKSALITKAGNKLIIGDKLGYLPKHPAALVAENKYPMIAGVTKDAGAFMMSRFYDDFQRVRSPNITEYIDVVLKHTTQERFHAIWRNLALTQIFTEEEKRSPTLQNLAQGLLELTNLIIFRAPLIDSIRYTSRAYPTYLYVFDYRGKFHRFGHLENPLPFGADATLSDDSIYLFPYPAEVTPLNPQDKAVSRTLTTMWVNFAKYGLPNFDAGIWPNVSSEYGPFVRIGNELELDYHFGEGIPVPNLYPEYFTTTTTSTSTTTTTTTERPNYDSRSRYPNYPSNYNVPNNYPSNRFAPNYLQENRRSDPYQNYPRNY